MDGQEGAAALVEAVTGLEEAVRGIERVLVIAIRVLDNCVFRYGCGCWSHSRQEKVRRKRLTDFRD
jgi:hypothetical protein